METTQAQAIAAVLCRAIDYFVARQADPLNQVPGFTKAAERDLAVAIEAVPDEA